MRIIIIFNVVTVSFAGLYGSVVFRAEHWNSGKLYSANAAYYDADDTHVTNFGPVCRGKGFIFLKRSFFFERMHLLSDIDFTNHYVITSKLRKLRGWSLQNEALETNFSNFTLI